MARLVFVIVLCMYLYVFVCTGVYTDVMQIKGCSAQLYGKG